MKKPPIVSEAEARKIAHNSPKHLEIFIHMAYETGFRISDILKIKFIDVGSVIKIKEQKTGKMRYANLSNWLLSEIFSFMPTGYSFDYVFLNPKTKKPYSRSAIYRQLKKVSEGMNIKASPHSLRGLYARNLYKLTRDIFYVQRSMNHKYVTTTAAYLGVDINALIIDAISNGGV